MSAIEDPCAAPGTISLAAGEAGLGERGVWAVGGVGRETAAVEATAGEDLLRVPSRGPQRQPGPMQEPVTPAGPGWTPSRERRPER